MLKNIFWLAIVTGLTLGARSAWGAGSPAAPAPEFLELYYVPQSDYETTDAAGLTQTSEGGKGYGTKVISPLGTGGFLQSEYQKNRYDGFDGVPSETEVKTLRAGLVISGGSGLYGLAEYIKQEVEASAQSFDDEGYGVHIGLRTSSAGPISFLVQAGYLDLDTLGAGFEYLLGAGYSLSLTMALYADYRNTTLEVDAGGKSTFADVRAGLRFKLGG